jgi:sensor domain CHASE-containing protein
VCFFSFSCLCILLQVEEKYSSWHTLQQDASQAREQNELLTNELQLQKEKLEQIQAEYDERGEFMFIANIGTFAAC